MKLKKWIKTRYANSILREVIRYFQFEYYKRQAIIAWKIDGKRRWVLEGKNGKMFVYSNDHIRLYNKLAKRKGQKPMDIAELMKKALYGTPAGSTGERRRNG